MKPLLPMELPALRKGPFTSAHVVRWCAAQQNWDRIHYDQVYAQQHAGLPERLINGGMKQHLLVQFLERAFPECRIERMEFRFAGADYVGESLELRGRVVELAPMNAALAHVELEIHNLERGGVTTTGRALVHSSGETGISSVPGEWSRLDVPGEGEDAAQRFGFALGCKLEEVRSDYPIDLSRLRLFADAIGEVDARYFDTEAARRAGFPAAVAPPLFPIHALELRPGSRPLSRDPAAMGREGVAEIGRSAGERLGLPSGKIVNGGSRIRIHSLASAGETVQGESRLMALISRPNAKSGPLVSIETLNRYTTSSGRALLDERIAIVYRGVSR
jgi:acyl dehydratase